MLCIITQHRRSRPLQRARLATQERREQDLPLGFTFFGPACALPVGIFLIGSNHSSPPPPPHTHTPQHPQHPPPPPYHLQTPPPPPPPPMVKVNPCQTEITGNHPPPPPPPCKRPPLSGLWEVNDAINLGLPGRLLLRVLPFCCLPLGLQFRLCTSGGGCGGGGGLGVNCVPFPLL